MTFKENILDIYDGFLEKTNDKLTELINSSSMTSEDQAALIGNVFASAMSNSVNAIHIEKQNELIYQQIVGEMIKNGGIKLSYNNDGSINWSETTGDGESLYQAQILLTQKQTSNYDKHMKKEVMNIISNFAGSFAVSAQTVPAHSTNALYKLAEDIVGNKDLYTVYQLANSADGSTVDDRE